MIVVSPFSPPAFGDLSFGLDIYLAAWISQSDRCLSFGVIRAISLKV
jgi:hypothetical protein